MVGKGFSNIQPTVKVSTQVKKSFSWFWMATLLVATTGVSLQQIYCYCLGRTTTLQVTSGAFGSDNAGMEVKKAGCCQKDSLPSKPSCCKKKMATASKNDRGCTKKTTKVFQMKTEFLVDKPVEKVFDFPLWINDFPILRRMSRPVICEATIFHRALPPPPLSGRDVCLRHELARC